ncbi:MAG: DnaA regulatory inactivator Hda [Oleiphilus sp.]|nr:MAG: DnaA regulatory inactivator Hda [Oleiphilus sp.]
MSFSDQLALPFQQTSDACFENYAGEANASAAKMLEGFVSEGREHFIYIAGPSGSGKTHLAIAALKRYENQNVRASYLSLRSLEKADEEALLEACEAFREYDAIILDDIGPEVLNPAMERFVFNLYNQVTLNGQLLVFAGCSVAQLELSLPDLASRLNAGMALRLQALSDSEKESVFRAAAAERGLAVSADVSAYIIRRSGRDLRELLGVLDVLDKAAWVEKQKLSIPFIKKVMTW